MPNELALPAWDGSVDSPSKRDSAKATKTLKKRGACPKSGARFVRLRFLDQKDVRVANKSVAQSSVSTF
jgi:hypothetical protein